MFLLRFVSSIYIFFIFISKFHYVSIKIHDRWIKTVHIYTLNSPLNSTMFLLRFVSSIYIFFIFISKFHYVSIKIHDRWIKTVHIYTLNSTMFLLRWVPQWWISKMHTTLNSTMFLLRLEPC